jgi:translation initiation factor RLI1
MKELVAKVKIRFYDWLGYTLINLSSLEISSSWTHIMSVLGSNAYDKSTEIGIKAGLFVKNPKSEEDPSQPRYIKRNPW